MARPAPARTRPAALPPRREGWSAQPRCRPRRALATRASSQCAAAWWRADRGSPPVYQKHGIGGEWPQRERRGELRWVAIAPSAPSPNQRATEGLLPRHGEGEFAVADAPGKTLGET